MIYEFNVDVEGVKRRFGAIINAEKDMDAPLKELGSFIKADVQDTFDAQGPGWQPLAASTMERRQGGGLGSKIAEERRNATMRRKLRSELGRAKKRLDKLTTSTDVKKIKGALAAVTRRKLVFAEFERLAAGGRRDLSLSGNKAGEKRVSSLLERMARAEEQGGRILGGLAGSITAKVSSGVLTISSKVKWAGVHNFGGTAGHGAQIPARPFLYMKPSYAEHLLLLLRQHFTAAWVE